MVKNGTLVREEFVDGPYAGHYNGAAWTDEELANQHGIPTVIEMKQGRYIDDIRVQHGDVMGPWHADSSSTPKSCNFRARDEIIFVQLSYNWAIDWVQFITRDGQICGDQTPDGSLETWLAHPGCVLSHLSGTSGTYGTLPDILLSLSFHWTCPYFSSQA